jgi:HD-GYP domain-containing protein (c-di-GMP phosphodiesterase class II)
MVQAMVQAIEVKDLSSAAHTWRVVLYTRALAERAGIDEALLDRLTTAAALHDVGKLDIPDHILQKPGPLTDEEFGVIKTHAVLGYDRLKGMGERDPILLEFVRHHHERWDGRGYPDGLAGEAIPLGPRYFAVIDSFDAMTSVRPYRSEVGERAVQHALDELEAGKGTRYWPAAVEAFASLVRSGATAWITEYFNDRCAVHYEHGTGVADRVRCRVTPTAPPSNGAASPAPPAPG